MAKLMFSRVTSYLLPQCRQYFKHTKTKTIQPVKVTNRKHPHQNERGETRPSRPKVNVIQGIEMSVLDHYESHPLENSVHALENRQSETEALDRSTRNLLRESRRIRYQTLENRFFKKKRKPNLLTWSAKEQMRLLHRQEPEFWSVEGLAEIFPVSKESVKKILTSRVRLHREGDIAQHDQDVQRNWMNLRSSLRSGHQLDDEALLEEWKSTENESLIPNAEGVKSLPYPRKTREIFNPQGPFSMIVRDCYEEKLKAVQVTKTEADKHESMSDVLHDMANLCDKIENKGISSLPPTSKTTATVEDIPKRNITINQRKDGRGFQKFRNDITADQVSPANYGKDISSTSHVRDNRIKGPVTFQKGNCIYDESGEFLYRLP